MSLKKQTRTSTLQNKLGKLGVKLTVIYANGSAESNRAYCTKADPDGFFEHGAIAECGSGSRTDLDSAIETIKKGVNMDQLAEKHPSVLIRYPRGIQVFKSIIDKKKIPEERDITVTIYYGSGGTGKTQHALSDARKLGISLYILSPPNGSNLWWDFYDGERGLLIDDFYGWLRPHDLYRVLDRYRYLIPIKGNTLNAEWLYVWITSNSAPDKFYKPAVMETLDPEAYSRRMHNIYYLSYYDADKSAVNIPYAEKETKKLNLGLAALTTSDELSSDYVTVPSPNIDSD